MTEDLDRLRAGFTKEMGKVAGHASRRCCGVEGRRRSGPAPHSAERYFCAPIRHRWHLFPRLLIGRQLNENMLSRANPLAWLGMSVLKVNMLWALHLTRLLRNFERGSCRYQRNSRCSGAPMRRPTNSAG